MQIIRQSSFRTTPWKNGGGLTHEALRMPADGVAFRWRVSVATIGASGPFSDFSGYRRYMALLRGAGLRLQFADGTAMSLRGIGAVAAFDGGSAAHCELLAGECTDLNLMVSADLPAPHVRILQLATASTLNAAPRESILIFALAGSVAITGCVSYAGSVAIASAGAGGVREILAPWDLALATAADGAVRLGSVEELIPAQVFLATLMDTA